MKKILAAAAAVVLIAVVGAGLYLGDCYPADQAAVAAMAGTEEVPVWTEDNLTLFGSEEADVGFIFYPGGKVEHTAYAPLLVELAREGVFCVLVEMPGNLAVLDPNGAEGVADRFPQVVQWYLGGHSLGGSMAAAYAADHREELAGLVLLAAYSTADLSGTDLPVLSLYGSEDGVLNRERYQECWENLPQTAQEVVLDGGNHGGFGSYGVQSGDGSADISAEEQRGVTVRYLVDFFERLS